MCQCDLSSHLSPAPLEGTRFGCQPLSCTLLAWIFSWKRAHSTLSSGGDWEELSLGMMSLQVACARGRRGDRPGGAGGSG